MVRNRLILVSLPFPQKRESTPTNAWMSACVGLTTAKKSFVETNQPKNKVMCRQHNKQLSLNSRKLGENKTVL